ncbi:MAG: hypothetical protein K5786_06135, partial [Treponema sp.]|nr:hypothetical protein [Treponema sp.]
NNLSTNLIGCIKESDGGVLLCNIDGDKEYFAFESDYKFIYLHHVSSDNQFKKQMIPLYSLSYETKPTGGVVNSNFANENICSDLNTENQGYRIEVLNVDNNNPLSASGCTFSKQAYVDEKITQVDALVKDCKKLVEGVYPKDVDATVNDVSKYASEITK